MNDGPGPMSARSLVMRSARVACVYALALGGLLAPLLRGGIVQGADIMLAFYHFRDLLWRSLRDGQLPLWNPYVFCGTPFFPAGGVFYLASWPFAWLPTAAGIHAELFVHLLVAGLGAHWLARRLGSQRAGAYACGLAYALSSVTIVLVFAGHLPRIDGRAWFPASLAAYLAYRDDGRARWLVLGACAVALQITAGHLQMTLYQLAALGIFALCAGPARELRRRAAAVLQLGLLGVALALVHLLPNVLWAQDSSRASSFEFATEGSLPFAGLLGLFVPHVFGDLVTSPYVGPGFVWSVNAYFGALAVVLAIVALTSARAQPQAEPGVQRAPAVRHLRVFAGLAGASLLLALGANTPVYRVLYATVPLFSWLREPTRALVIAELGFAVLAGAAVHQLATGNPRTRVHGARAFAALAAFSLLGALALRAGWLPDWALGLVQLREGTAPAARLLRGAAQLGSRMGWLGVLALALAAALAAAARPRVARSVPVLICALLWLEPMLFSRRFVATIPLAVFAWEPPIPALLARHGKDRFRVLDSRDANHFNFGMSHRVSSPNGYDGSIGARYNRFTNAILQLPPGEYTPVLGIDRDSPLLDLLNVRYVFVPEARAAGGQARARILGRRNPLGAAWLVATARHVPDEAQALEQLRSGAVDPATTALLHDAQAPALAPASGAGAAAGSVRFVREQPNRIVFDARAERPAYLVLSEMQRDGWSATVDGAPAPVVRVDYLLRAVPLRAGSHRVVLSYWPPGLSAGLLGSLLAAFICLALLLRGRALARARG